MNSDNEHITCSIDILNSKPKSSYCCHLCSAVVKTNANLKAHLIKTHQIIESPADQAFYSKKKSKIQIIYHCPIENCKYHISTGKGVNKFSILKQHYNWVHVPHAFSCQSCNKSFGTAPALKYHEKHCGQRFPCSICKSDFSEEKFLTYHQNHIHNKKQKFKENKSIRRHANGDNSQGDISGNQSQADRIQILQPIYIPMIFPVSASSDPNLISSMKDSTLANMAMLSKLRVLKPEMRDADTQVNLFPSPGCGGCSSDGCQHMLGYCSVAQMSVPSGNSGGGGDGGGALGMGPQFHGGWGGLNSANSVVAGPTRHDFYSGHPSERLDYLNSCCHASMQTVPYHSFDNFFHVETQTKLAGFVGARGTELGMVTAGNTFHPGVPGADEDDEIDEDDDELMSSLFTDMHGPPHKQHEQHEQHDELMMRLADNHTQTQPYLPLDISNSLAYLTDIETQTNFQDIEDLLYSE